MPEVIVEEEDTCLLIGAGQSTEMPKETFGRLVTEALNQRTQAVGSVRSEGGQPLRLVAIVYDLDREPICREDWITEALGKILDEVDRRGLGSLALPMLGARHGHFPATRFIELLRAALAGRESTSLGRIWLMVPWGTGCDILEPLRQHDPK